MIRMLIIGYVFAIRSERALCRDAIAVTLLACEKAQLVLDALNGSSADPERIGSLENAGAVAQQPLCLALDGRVDLGPAELHTLHHSALVLLFIRDAPCTDFCNNICQDPDIRNIR
jgi:hypothetical protein